MNWLARIFQKPDYVRLLEEERTRLLRELSDERLRHIAELERFRASISELRKENRGLVSSLLGTVGLPPLTEEHQAALPHIRRRSLHQMQAHVEHESAIRAAMRERAEQERTGQQEAPDAKASA